MLGRRAIGARSAFWKGHIRLIRWPSYLFKGVAWLVIVCFSVNCLTPAVVAAKTLSHDAKLATPPAKTEFDKASDALIALEDTLDRMNRRLNGQYEYAWQATLAKKSHAVAPKAATRVDLLPLHKKLATDITKFKAQQPAIQAYFAETKSQLRTAQAATAIQTRAQAHAEKINQLSAKLDSLLAAIDSARTDADYKSAVAAASNSCTRTHPSPSEPSSIPEHLAFGPSKTRARHALTDPAALRKKLGLTTSVTPQSNAKSTASSGESLAPRQEAGDGHH